MKRWSHILTVILLFFAAGQAICAQQLDSAVRESLDRRLAEYFIALEHEDTDAQKEECDFIIDICTDSLMRQHVALSIYEHYRDSKIMGTEAVAIHVYDRWFGSGRVKMRNEMEALAAKVFADFNRMSLVGNKAPSLVLSDPDGNVRTIYGDGASGGRFSILYFYDTDCAVCKSRTVLLRNLLETEEFPVDLVAVYADDDEVAWRTYMREQLTVGSDGVRVTHLWDPDMESDFQRRYGVLQTPRMFLVAPDGTIIGRGLDVQALSVMLHGIFDEVELQYGSKESEELFDRVIGRSASVREVSDAADMIAAAALQKGDTVMCRQLIGDLLYYLAAGTDEGSREGLNHVIDRYVLGMNDIWKSQDDSVKVIGYAKMMDDLLSRSEPGTRIADMKLPGTLLRHSGTKEKNMSLRKIGARRNIILFYTQGCHLCAAEKEAASALVHSDKKTRVFMVNVDEVLAESPALAGRMFDTFDLSALPFVIETDKKGYITRRYISLKNIDF